MLDKYYFLTDATFANFLLFFFTDVQITFELIIRKEVSLLACLIFARKSDYPNYCSDNILRLLNNQSVGFMAEETEHPSIKLIAVRYNNLGNSIFKREIFFS